MQEGTAPGVLITYFLYAVILTVPVSLILLLLYRRSVKRAMDAASEAGLSVASVHLAPKPRVACSSTEIQSRERRLRLRLALVYAIGGAAAAAVWTWVYFQSPDLEFAGLRGFVVWYVLCWPVPITFAALLSLPWRRTFWFLAAYLAVGMLVIAVWSTVRHLVSGQPGIHTVENLRSFLYLLAVEAGPPSLVMLIALNRRIRGVSPLALAGLLVFSFSSVGVTALFVRLMDVAGLRSGLLTVGLNWFFMLATVPVGYVCWRLLALLSAGYRRKSFSDAQLVADLFWFIVAFLFTAEFTRDFGWKGISGLAGFVAYRACAQSGLKIAGAPAAPGITLLVLRVFGFRGRSEKLFDSVVQRWRFHGPVVMIAGADLAMRTIDSDETLAFLAGDLRSRFVRDSQDLEQRLGHVDESRDPDGRFRVTEFFCHQNTWSGTLAALLQRSDTILMDLRAFSSKNAGCIYELEQLGDQQRLPDTVLLIDQTSDLALIESAAGASGPVGAPPLHIANVQSGSDAESERVYRALCGLHDSPRTTAAKG